MEWAMARIRSARWLYARTMTWNLPARGRVVVEVRVLRSPPWFRQPLQAHLEVPRQLEDVVELRALTFAPACALVAGDAGRAADIHLRGREADRLQLRHDAEAGGHLTRPAFGRRFLCHAGNSGE